jgi:hypothetical protein
MGLGRIDAAVLADIADAIRSKAGTSGTLKPREMAAAVAALDGTDAGGYEEVAWEGPASGVVSDRVFSDVADAVRAHNGETGLYRPAQLGAAIRALTWERGLKVRALLLFDGTLEFSFRRATGSSLGSVAARWTVDEAGYSSASARPWDADKLKVTRVVFDSTFLYAGMSNLAYLCCAFRNCTEVLGFENCTYATNVTQMFANCSSLETIWAEGFDGSHVTSASSAFYGCYRLVGGADGFVPATTTGAAALTTGAGGVLTDPGSDARTWYRAFYYADGEAVLTAAEEPEEGRELAASGRICAVGRYQGLGYAPWDGTAGPTHREHLARATFAEDMAGYGTVNLQYLFYSCTALEAVEGMGNLAGAGSLRYAFSSTALAGLDLRGLDPSGLTDVTCCFSGCSSLASIVVDAGWEPPSGLVGLQCFYGCTSLVGGNGTAYDAANTGCAYLRVDAEGSPGYLTGA